MPALYFVVVIDVCACSQRWAGSGKARNQHAGNWGVCICGLLARRGWPLGGGTGVGCASGGLAERSVQVSLQGGHSIPLSTQVFFFAHACISAIGAPPTAESARRRRAFCCLPQSVGMSWEFTCGVRSGARGGSVFCEGLFFGGGEPCCKSVWARTQAKLCTTADTEISVAQAVSQPLLSLLCVPHTYFEQQPSHSHEFGVFLPHFDDHTVVSC